MAQRHNRNPLLLILHVGANSFVVQALSLSLYPAMYFSPPHTHTYTHLQVALLAVRHTQVVQRVRVARRKAQRALVQRNALVQPPGHLDLGACRRTTTGSSSSHTVRLCL